MARNMFARKEGSMPNGHSHTIGSVDYTWLNVIIASLHGRQASKWAVICVCFKDDPATLPDLQHYRALFTRAGAGAAGVNLAAFDGVVVSAFGSTDLCGWIGGMAALCDQDSLQPSLLGQEMGHGYGLDHARVNGSTADYADPWDVMSTAMWPTMAPNAA